MTIQANGHWGGDAAKYAERLTVTVKTEDKARNLAAVYRLLRDHPAGLKILAAAAAEEFEATALHAD